MGRSSVFRKGSQWGDIKHNEPLQCGWAPKEGRITNQCTGIFRYVTRKIQWLQPLCWCKVIFRKLEYLRVVWLNDVRRLVLDFPEVTEKPHHRISSFRVRDKIFCYHSRWSTPSHNAYYRIYGYSDWYDAGGLWKAIMGQAFRRGSSQFESS